MLCRPIVPRQVKIKGKLVWLVRVPKDLVSPNSPKTRFFGDDAQAAATFAKNLTRSRVSLGGEFLKLTQPEQSAILWLIRDLGVEELVKAGKFWRERKVETERPFSEVAKECLESKRLAGIRENSLHQLKNTWRTFPHQSKPVSAITAREIDGWLSTKPILRTRKNHRTNLQTLFNWCLRRKLVSSNPIDGVEPPRVPFKAVDILTVPELEKLLATALALDAALLGFICPVLFGGLRVEESRRTTPDNFKDGFVDIGGEQTKLNVRRAFAVQPILADWLAVPGVELGGVNVVKRMRKVRAAAGIRFPANCLRHSAASYWLAILGAKDAARMLGHSETTLFKHYAAKVSAQDAADFLKLRPYFGPGRV